MVRVRFAPSPTGPLHLGGIRTALFNYLFAKKNGGKFILRIEDTDRKRFNKKSESYILETLKWCKIEPDEGVGYGGPYFPYYQSKRGSIYRFYLSKLLKKGLAYYAFDTDHDLNSIRKKYLNKGSTFSYNASVRKNLKNSLTMTKKELKTQFRSGNSYVIRFKIKPGDKVEMYDLIRGIIVINTDNLDDKILFKSDGTATYHLANTIDDHLMKITHVIRGEEWLPSMSLHLLMYKAFNWNPPNFAHLPLILKNDGKGKISKRFINNLDYPIFPLKWKDSENKDILGFRELGYFPDAFVNMLALLGWNPGTKKEIFSLQELSKLFSLEKVNKSSVFFNIKKANWFNKQYLKNKKEEIFSHLSLELKKRSIFSTKNYIYKVIDCIINRIHFIHEIWKHSFYFFIGPISYDYSFFNQICYKKTIDRLDNWKKLLLSIHPYTSINLKSFFDKENNKRKMMQIFRLSLVGSIKGYDLIIILKMIGKEECIHRIDRLIKKIRKKLE
ncbi:glutamate--tRNA ligase [Blattabacterium cuenoti]|uniref:glutamate--tRNA ligase n=1 Tax=Blattabacterium cuenoti TaxID=1653831 RepID=UPI00163C04B0|nr:glutamate--tRNA ligase [Blattabacterium cuenoti]